MGSLSGRLASFDSEWCGCGCGYYLACYYQPCDGYWVSFSTHAPMTAERFLTSCAKNDWALAGHNIRSDFHQLGIYPDVEVFDSLVISWLDNENGSHKLKELAPRVLGRTLEDPITVKVVDGKRVTYFKGVHIAEADQTDVEVYCRADAKATLGLALHYWDKLPNNLREWYAEVEMPLDRVVFGMEQAGIRLDTDTMLKETLHLRTRRAILHRQLVSEVGYEFNLGSPDQVAKVLFTKEWEDKERGPVGIYKACRTHKKPLKPVPEGCMYDGYKCGCPTELKEGWVPVTRKGFGLKPGKKTPGGKPATDEEVLLKYESHPVVSRLLDWKETDKVLGTYLEAFPRFMQEDRLYGHFNTTGTVTGRFSSSDPNLQNIPSRGDLGRRVRGLFIPEPGHLLVVADLDQLELRLLASFCKDPAMLEAFASGEDVHQAMADKMSVDRDLAKNINYSIAYDASAKTIQRKYAPNQPLRVIEEAMELHRETFPGVYEWKERVRRFARQHGFVYTLGMRKRHLPEVRSNDPRIRHRAERQAVNCVIQGSGGDIMRKAMVLMGEREVPLLLQVHDEVVAEVVEPGVQQVVNDIWWSFQQSGEAFGLVVPLMCTPKVVKSWGEAKDKVQKQEAA